MASRETLFRVSLLVSSLFCAAAFGQGVGTPTSASDEDVGAWTVTIGAGTTSATTTGSSGPRDETTGAADQYSCYNVNEQAARENCLRAMQVTGSENRRQ